MKRWWSVVATLLCMAAPMCAQTRPEEGGHEWQLWTGGGHSVSGGTSNTGIFNAGLRYGWILTAPHGPGFLNGRFEYAVDAIPMFLVFQPRNTTYGFGVNPLGLKWNFATRGDVVPYVELGGGTLFTTNEVPTGTSKINFTSSAAFGVHFLRERAWTAEVRYTHISNAGLESPNPGINTLQFRIGIGRFMGRK
jgi:lipid A 3-O-deacylase